MEVPEQMLVLPLTAVGAAGAVITVSVCKETEELPQAFNAITLIVPPLVPAVNAITLVVDVPVHPPGTDQLYEVAPLTGTTL